MANSNSPRRGGKRVKPAKPRPDFPLVANGNGQWSKQIRGKVYYFGPWEDPQAALSRYLDVRDDRQAGRTPRPRNDDRLTLGDLVNEFLNFKRQLVDSGELSARSHREYQATGKTLVTILGRSTVVEEIRPDDLLRVRNKLAETRGPIALGSEIGRCRVLLNFAYDQELTDKKVRFGKAFRKPSKKTLRQHKAKRDLANGKRFFEATEIRQLIDAAGVPMRAMIYLAINAGFGNADCGKLVASALDLDRGFVAFPRPKTGIDRLAFLWPKTIEAIQQAIAERPDHKREEDAELVFITKYGLPWFKETSSTNPVSQEFRKLLKATGLHRHGVGFYALRHTFETVAGACRDQVAVNHVMGHMDNTMAGEYREAIGDDRLQHVAKTVRTWLFPPNDQADDEEPATVKFPAAG
jgi:integrase